MTLAWNIVRGLIAAAIIVAVAELSKRYPRYGALLLSLPILSVLAFASSWLQHHDSKALSEMARETIVLVVLALPFFIPLAFADQWGLNFWTALLAGIGLATLTVGGWLLLAR